MNANQRMAQATFDEGDGSWPLSKGALLAICLLVPVAGGIAINMLYGRVSPAAARYATRVTFRALGVMMLVGGVLGACAGMLPRRRAHDGAPTAPPTAAPPR